MNKKFILLFLFVGIISAIEPRLYSETVQISSNEEIGSMLEENDEDSIIEDADDEMPDIPELPEFEPLPELTRFQEVTFAVGVYLFMTYDLLMQRYAAVKRSISNKVKYLIRKETCQQDTSSLSM